MVRRVTVLCLWLLCGAALGATPARQAPAPDLRQVEAGQRDRERERDVARAEAEAAQIEAAQLAAQLAALNASADSGDRAVSEKRLQLAALNARETALAERLGANQARLARLLGALELFRADPPPALLVDPHDIRAAVRAAILIRAITPELERRARDLRAQALELKQVRRRQETTSEALFVGESDVAERRARVESLLAAKVALQHQAAAEAQIAGLDAQALAARAEALRHPAPGRPLPPAPSMTPPPDPEHAGLFGRPKMFTAPVQGVLTQRFGEPDAGGRDHALGWTWRAADGAQVVAPASGVVEYAEPLRGWGMVVILKLGGGYRLVLAGLDAVSAATGQSVGQGQPVGRMGRSGAGALYFEIRKNGAVIDPAHWLPVPPPTTDKR